MKVNKLIQRMYEACVSGDTEAEQKLWKKILRKSLKRKRTHSIQ